MDNRHLKIFMEVYERGNMTAAAESLYISQPAVSQVIKELEQHYGSTLFERYPKKLYPTHAGTLLYDYAKKILGLFDDIDRDMRASSETGEMIIGANLSAGTVLLPKCIDRFHEIYPDTVIRVRMQGSAGLTEQLYRNAIDFALMEDLLYDDVLVQSPFYRDRIVLVCAPDYPLAQEPEVSLFDLRREPFLLRAKGAGVRDKFDYLMKINRMEVNPLWESSSTRSLIHAAQAGYGIAVLPYLLVKDDLDRQSLVWLNVREEESLERNLNITYHRDKVFDEKMETFIEIVREMDFS